MFVCDSHSQLPAGMSRDLEAVAMRREEEDQLPPSWEDLMEKELETTDEHEVMAANEE